MKEIVCGRGFLGSNLEKYLTEKDKEVIILPVEMLMDPQAMHEFFLEQGEYHLYYLAAYGNLHGQDNLDEIYRAIVIKFLNLLQATQETQLKSLVTAGTTSEYGDKTEVMTESMMLEPRTFYGAAKAAATHLAQVWALQKKAPIVIFRPASITGVGEQPIHLIPTLIRSCIFQEAIPFVGEPVHDYIDVWDVCSALEVLSERGVSGEIYNVGSGVQRSNLIVKEMVESIVGKPTKVNKSAKLNPQNISTVWVVDNSKMKSLGWKPKVTFLNSLKQMIHAI